MKKDIVDRTLNFAIEVIRVAEMLPKRESGKIVARQIIKSGTSIGANVEEAQDASSKKDFVSKMGIALCEARETQYWIKIIKRIGLLTQGTG